MVRENKGIFRSKGDLNHKTAVVFPVTVLCNGTVVLFGNGLDQGKAQTIAENGTIGISAIKVVKDTFSVLWWDVRPVIDNGKKILIILRGQGDGDFPF